MNMLCSYFIYVFLTIKYKLLLSALKSTINKTDQCVCCDLTNVLLCFQTCYRSHVSLPLARTNDVVFPNFS